MDLTPRECCPRNVAHLRSPDRRGHFICRACLSKAGKRGAAVVHRQRVANADSDYTSTPHPSAYYEESDVNL